MTGLPRDVQHPKPLEAVATIPAAAAGWAGWDWGAEEWVPYGHHLHRRVFFSLLKVCFILGSCPSTAA